MARQPTALIADDEPLLRDALKKQLAQVWPELSVIAEARNGREAIRLFDAHEPDVCFLDVHMPGLSGIDAAKHIGPRSHVVFITAYGDYAVEAFTTGALDYLLKPVEDERLVITVTRLRERIEGARPAVNTEALLRQLAADLAELQIKKAAEPLRWIRAQVGSTVHLIAVDDIDYIRSDAKYTTIAWRGDNGQPREAVIRTALKDLLRQLDSEKFAQVHRSIIVNLRSIKHVRRQGNETAEIHLKGRAEPLSVSRTYLSLFRQM